MSSRRRSVSLVSFGFVIMGCAAAACGDSSGSPAAAQQPDASPVLGPDAASADGGASPEADVGEAGPTCTPKAGFDTAVKLGTLGGSYAHESLVLGPNDEPFVAFVAYDLANRAASALYFVAYDAKKCAWKSPVKVDTVDNLTDNPTLREVQLARDKSTGKLALAYEIAAHLPAPNGDTLMMLAHSSDDGATWSKEQVAHDDGAPGDNTVYYLAHPTVSVGGGKTVYAYYSHFNIGNGCSVGSECNAWTVLTRSGDSGPFAGGIVQAASGNLGGEDLSGAVAFDSGGNAGFVFYSRPVTASQTLLLNYVKVGQTKAVGVFDSQSVQNDQPALTLAFEGTKPRVAGALRRSATGAGTDVWFSASDDGTTWSAPVEMPKDGSDGMGSYISMAASPSGAGLTVAADFTSGTDMRGQCGGPKLSVTTNDTSFTTCGAGTTAAGSDIGFAGSYVQLAYAANGKRVLAFDYPTDTMILPAGVTVWREP